MLVLWGTPCALRLRPILKEFSDFLEAYSLESKALRLAGWIYKGVERKWGSHDQLPLSAHALEVALLLAFAGQRQELIAAGALHDLYEDYAKFDRRPRVTSACCWVRSMPRPGGAARCHRAAQGGRRG